jgi:hypothetical protein
VGFRGRVARREECEPHPTAATAAPRPHPGGERRRGPWRSTRPPGGLCVIDLPTLEPRSYLCPRAGLQTRAAPVPGGHLPDRTLRLHLAGRPRARHRRTGGASLRPRADERAAKARCPAHGAFPADLSAVEQHPSGRGASSVGAPGANGGPSARGASSVGAPGANGGPSARGASSVGAPGANGGPSAHGASSVGAPGAWRSSGHLAPTHRDPHEPLGGSSQRATRLGRSLHGHMMDRVGPWSGLCCEPRWTHATVMGRRAIRCRGHGMGPRPKARRSHADPPG